MSGLPATPAGARVAILTVDDDPVVDAQLEAWLMSDRRPVAEIKVVGHRWSARSSEVREFLARNQVPYHCYQSEDAEGARLIAAAAADERALPVVITTDGTVAIQPTAPASTSPGGSW